MKKKLVGLSGLVSAAALLTPLLAFAQRGVGCDAVRADIDTIQYIICRIADLLDLIIPILVVLGILYFVLGVVQYVIASEEEAKKKGRDRMIYGIIGLVVIVALWGLVFIVNKTFGLGAGRPQPFDVPAVDY